MIAIIVLIIAAIAISAIAIGRAIPVDGHGPRPYRDNYDSRHPR